MKNKSILYILTATLATLISFTIAACAHKHTLVRHDSIEPGHETPGISEFWECTDCGKYFSDQNGVTEIPDKSSVIIPAIGHSVNEAWKNDDFSHWKTCSVCKQRCYETQHSFGENKTCSVCGFVDLFTQGLEFEKIEGEEAYEVTGIGDSTETAIYVRNTFKGLPVKRIGEDAFKNATCITSVVLPDSVTTICYGAFRGCAKLTDIAIPESVTSIGPVAFEGCAALSEISLPNGITSLGEDTFEGCTSLRFNEYDSSFYVGNEQNPFLVLIKPKTDAVADCTIHEETRLIAASAFFNSQLTSISIGAKLKYIDAYAFRNCEKLNDIIFPDGLISIGYASFMFCRSLSDLIIPDSVVYLGDYAFAGCTGSKGGLKSVAVGNGISRIGIGAFNSCADLNIITLPFVGEIENGTTNNWFGYVFGADKSDQNSLYVPASLKTVSITGGNSIGGFQDCENIESITFSDNVSSIESMAFYGCTRLRNLSFFDYSTGKATAKSKDGGKGLIIPNSVTFIGEYAFVDCAKLEFYSYGNAFYVGSEQNPYLALVKATTESIIGCEINTDTRFILTYAFKNCKIINSIFIPDNIQSIGEFAFLNCIGLTRVTFESGEKNLDLKATAFEGCKNLIYTRFDNGLYLGSEQNPFRILISAVNTEIIGITINPNTKVIGKNAFLECAGLENISIPDGVLTIDDYAFSKSGLQSVVIPDSVTFIGDYSFADCRSLKSIDIPDSVTHVGIGAFYFCAGLASVTIGTGVSEIGDYLFSQCYSLINISISENVKYIGEYAFYNCYSLKNLDLPDKIVSIGAFAFARTFLDELTIGKDLKLIKPNAFYSDKNFKIKKVCFKGTEEEWSEISITAFNIPLTSANIYFYSEIKPEEEGNFWHYGTDGVTKVFWE